MSDKPGPEHHCGRPGCGHAHRGARYCSRCFCDAFVEPTVQQITQQKKARISIDVYFCGDTMFDGKRLPSDTRVASVYDWESLIGLVTKEYPPDQVYPVYGSEAEKAAYYAYAKLCHDVTGPQRAMLAALNNGAKPGVYWAGSMGIKDYGYYAVVSET
jgi:hypothetical protein